MLYDELMLNHTEVHGQEEVPAPVTEVSTPSMEIIRSPAWDDGPMLWQGATFYRSDEVCNVYFDDGRRHRGTIAEVIDFWNQNGAEWCEMDEPDSGDMDENAAACYGDSFGPRPK